MEVIEVSKKFRLVCYEIMDGAYDSIDKLDAFPEYAHQATAVKAAVAFFDRDYDKAIDLVKDVMPYWDEWYYSNVSSEYMTAMAFAAKETCREEEVRAVIREEQERLFSSDREKCEAGKQQRYNYCKLMLDYLDTGILPKSKEELEYTVPADAKTKEELISSMKLKTATVADKAKLYNVLCTKGLPEDAIGVYEEIKDERLSEMCHENAIIRYLHLGQDEKALEAIERLATARMWMVAAPTQVRPMVFFKHPMMHKFLRDENSLRRIRAAAFIDNGTVKRK